jgi:phage gpG-like protein
MFVIATVDIADVERGLAAMEHRSRTLGPVFTGLKKPLRDDQREHKKAKSGPESPWAPRAESTKHGGTRKLARSLLGRLPSAVKYSSTPLSVVAESRVGWSEAHQEGATVGHGARLPARPFLWLSDKLLDIAAEALVAALERAWGGLR